MSRPSLEGCWAKLCRAEEQIDALLDEITAWIESKPYEVSTEPDRREGGWQFFKFQNVSPAPLRLGVLFGEAVHNLRSSLDLLVWQLVRLNKHTPATRNGFPVFQWRRANPKFPDRPCWDKKATRPLIGVHPDHVAQIREMQPFRRGNRAHQHPLYVLTELWNIDKHRVIHPGALNAPSDVLPANLSVDYGGFPGVHGQIVVATGRLKSGADAFGFRMTSAPYGIPKFIDMEGEFPIQVKFGRRRLTTRNLKEIGAYISENILERFASEFPRSSSDPCLFYQDPPDPIFPKREKGGLVKIIRPEDTRKRFSGWKVWFNPGEVLRLPDGTIRTSIPMWHFKPSDPRQPVFLVGAEFDPDRFRQIALRHVPPDVLDAVLEHFSPTRRTIAGRTMYAPT